MFESCLIRAAESRDIDQICDLWRDLMAQHAKYDPFWESAEGAGNIFRSWMNEQIIVETSCVVVASSGEKIIGYVGGLEKFHPPVFRLTRHLLLTDMYVLPEARGHGVGSALIQHVKMWAASQAYERIELSAAPQNDAGLRFWARMGFVEYQRYFASMIIDQ